MRRLARRASPRYSHGHELRAGDVLLIFTDGVPEAHSPDEEEFGEDRLMQLLRETGTSPPTGSARGFPPR